MVERTQNKILKNKKKNFTLPEPKYDFGKADSNKIHRNYSILLRSKNIMTRMVFSN